MKKRAYRSVSVKHVKIDEVLASLVQGPVWAGMDVSKEEVLVVLRDGAGACLRPWKVKQPSEVGELVTRLVELGRQRSVTTAMESTGTYGDALRQSLGDAGLAVQRVSGKAASDYAEIFDGVPSAHDGKDAAVVAELAAIGKGRPWPWQPPSAWEGELEDQVAWMDTQQDILQLWLGRLESLLARHWPEVYGKLGLNSATLLRALAEYGGPAGLAQDAAAADRLARWGGPFLRKEKIAVVLDSARATIGVRMTAEAAQRVQRYAQEALRGRDELRGARRALQRLSRENETTRRMALVLGSATACVLYATVGEPQKYACGAAYRKAMGLNLKERSSGHYQGQLKITKRGSSLARRWLFFAALRIAQRAPVRSWFEAKKRKDQDRGCGAVVAVMRKLALAVHCVATRDEPFALERLFPGRPWPGSSATTASRPAATSAALPLGALPPDPRDLSHSRQSRKGKKRAAAKPGAPPALSVSAPGSALGSAPAGALSSAQVRESIAVPTCRDMNPLD